MTEEPLKQKQHREKCWSLCNMFKKKRREESSDPITHPSNPTTGTVTIRNEGDLSSAYSSQIHSAAQSPPNSPRVFTLIDYEIKTPAWARLPSSNSLGKESKFKEELDITTQNFDKFLIRRDASGLFAKAIKATEKEREAFLLPEHKHLSRKALVRPRSASYCPPKGTGDSVKHRKEPSQPIRSHSDSQLHRAHARFLTPDYATNHEPCEISQISRRRQYSIHLTDPHDRRKSSDRISTHLGSHKHHSHNQFLSPESALRIEPTLPVDTDQSRRQSLDPGGLHDTLLAAPNHENTEPHMTSLNSLVRRIMTISSSTESGFTQDKLELFPALTISHPRTNSNESQEHARSNLSTRSIDAVLTSTVEQTPGAWARYPSHTRSSRTGSAGTSDKVWARDFEYTGNSTAAVDANNLSGEDGTGVRDVSIDVGKGKKARRGRRRKIAVVEKGLEVLQNYREFFTSPSMEYLRHGHGKRSSISPGGSHVEPDLELLPEV
jgi:hypothetical protein